MTDHPLNNFKGGRESWRGGEGVNEVAIGIFCKLYSEGGRGVNNEFDVSVDIFKLVNWVELYQ